MFEQKLLSQSLKGWRGIVLILGIMASVLIGSLFFSILELRIGNNASLGFLLYSFAIAWFLLVRYVLGFVYTINDSYLRICRIYGKRQRLMCDIWLNTIQAYGSPEDMRKRFPDARISRAVKSKSELAPFAIAYTASDRTQITIIQPNDELRKRIIDAFKGR